MRESMSRLPRLLRRTHSPRVLPAEGGFAGLFQLDFSGWAVCPASIKDPVLVSGTDGVGTKLKVAQLAGRAQHGRHRSRGDVRERRAVLRGGAAVLSGLCGDGRRMIRRCSKQIVSGISDGCVASDMALIGGETAIMPDMYQAEDYDLAGFCVGVVERAKVLDGSTISPGDAVIGVASSGLHSNGYSLVRKIVFDIAKLGC